MTGYPFWVPNEDNFDLSAYTRRTIGFAPSGRVDYGSKYQLSLENLVQQIMHTCISQNRAAVHGSS